MVAAIVNHEIRWLAPAPLWSQKGVSLAPPLNGSFDQPSILRFDSDLFMDELLALTAYRPQNLDEWIARPETWREPMRKPATATKLRLIEPISQLAISQDRRRSGPADNLPDTSGTGSSEDTAGEPKPFKLFQPAHQRFYLVSAALVCRQPGLPDRAVDKGKQEQVSFVIRRYFHQDEDDLSTGNPRGNEGKEYAFVNTDNGYAWKEIANNERGLVQEEEERLPMFGITYDDNNYRRRMFAGLIPVGKRETYQGAKGLPNDDGTIDEALDRDRRRMLFDAEVIAPWKALLEQSESIVAVLNTTDNQDFSYLYETLPPGEPDGQLNNILAAAREQIQTGSWYILLDFFLFLDKYLKDVWLVLKNNTSTSNLNKQAKKDLVDQIRTISLTSNADFLISTNYSDVKATLVDALKAIENYRDSLESVDTPFDRTDLSNPTNQDWPNFLFPFIDPNGDAVLSVVPSSIAAAEDYLNEFADLLEGALDEATDPPPELEPPQQHWNARNAWFVIRCVYERPNCGPFHPETLSHPTEPFQMAPFFEPDAPARPIRIPMPMDISPAGLRKYKRNTSLMISDMLCGKIKKIKRITFADLVLSVLPWPFHKDLPNVNDTAPCGSPDSNFGMYCSLSIPIVTLCALILLIIIVALFDTFFRWIPYLFTCFPISRLTGKKND